MDVAHLDIGTGVLRRAVHGFSRVLFGVRIFLTIDLGHAAEQESIGRIRLGGDDLISRLKKGVDIALPHCDCGERALGISQVGTQADSLAPLGFRSSFVSLLVESQAQLVVGDSVIAVVLEGILQ